MFLGQMLALLKHVQLCAHAHVCLCTFAYGICASVWLSLQYICYCMDIAFLCVWAYVTPTSVSQLHTRVIYILVPQLHYVLTVLEFLVIYLSFHGH